MSGRHSIRIPVHGFIELDDWEWDIVNHPVFQRLRRIRQLAFSEHIYPGSTHTRFEHSLGVLHVATKMFGVLRAKHESPMSDRYGFDQATFDRCLSLVRLAALLHDVGHAPLSHSGESLMPTVKGKRIDHEDYSFYLIAEGMKDVIDNHKLNRERLCITGKEVASFYLGKSDVSPKILLFRDLVSGQLDADRMDYLLRDSHHCGVTYGFYDLNRILDTLVFVETITNDGSPSLQIGIESGGRHAAEGLILARYFMFEQVYFQKTRMAYDYHGSQCLKAALSVGGALPNPATAAGRAAYLKMDDWFLFESIRSMSGRHAEAILNHRHDRQVWSTPEVASGDDLKRYVALLKGLKKAKIDSWAADASKSWYKTGSSELLIAERPENGFFRGRPLTEVSETAAKIRDSEQRRIYVPADQRDAARIVVEKGAR